MNPLFVARRALSLRLSALLIIALVPLVVGLAAGCSDDSQAVSGDAAGLKVDAGLDGAVLTDGGLNDSGAADTVGATDTVSLDVPPDAAPLDVATGDVPPDATITQQACTSNDDCTSGYCLPTPDGRFCAQICVTSCPTDFTCKELLSASDVVYVCVHKSPFRCAPCANDKDCAVAGKASGGVCIQLAGGGFCAEACGAGSGKTDACVGAGFTCTGAKTLSGGDTQACVPDSGECPCPDGKKGFCQLTNAEGSCPGSYICQAGKAGKCSGQVPSAEACNLTDDDCDGQTDESVASISCDISNKYGTCKGSTLCVAGTTLCQGSNPTPEVCNGIDDNCSGAVDEGFPDTDKDGEADCVDGDDDNDTVLDGQDNCPLTSNVSQTDNDNDSLGDACDPDDDNDGVFDSNDTCPLVPNKAQTDTDKDGKGDACDCDIDDDGVANAGLSSDGVECPKPVTPDNCVFTKNADQKDTDKDGAGDACDGDKDGDGDPDNTDCKPEDPAISHAAKEVCDGVDNDCDGITDEEDAVGCGFLWLDQDGDGWGGTQKKCLCKKVSQFSATKGGDCDDKDKAVNPDAPEICGNSKDDNCTAGETDKGAQGCTDYYQDADGDGYGVKVIGGLSGASGAVCLCAPTGDLTAKKAGDCDDNDAAKSPALTELCQDKKDNNCNGEIDEANCQGCKQVYKDGDQDGFGVATDKQCLSAPAFPYTAFVSGDCDDKDANIKPGALEVCNGKDDNCDNVTDPQGSTGCTQFYPDVDKDTYGAKVSAQCLCKSTGTWTATKTGDCDDGNGKINPAAKEICNKLDDNCNTQVDEGLIKTYYKDNDGDGYGSVSTLQDCAAVTGYVEKSGDCNDYNKAIHPAAKELCNGTDDDCNGFIDDKLPLANIYTDVDGDGFGSKNAKVQKHCLTATGEAPLGYSTTNDDCDDSKSTAYPNAPELCDGILNNCNQKVKDAHCPTKCEGAWPIFLGGSSGFPAIAQLDGDNNLEVIARNAGAARAYKHDGSTLWKTAMSVSYSYPAVADMNGDATVDLVMPDHAQNVFILNGGNGAVLASYKTPGARGYYGALVFDFDGDGANDILATGNSPYQLILLDKTLKVKKMVPLAPLPGESFSLASAGAFDLKGDGVVQLFLGSGNWTCVADPTSCKGRLYAFNLDGTYANDPTWTKANLPFYEVKGYPTSYAGEGRWAFYADADGDGVNEVYHSFSASNSDLWKKDGTPHALSGKLGWGAAPTLAPVKPDGTLDLTGKLYPAHGPVVDIDGDGTYERIGNGAGGLTIYKAGKVMDGFPLNISADPPIIGDINRDGRLDIIFTSGSNNSLNCYSLGAGTYTERNVLNAGTINGTSRGHYPTGGFDPFEPNDIRNKVFDPKTTKDPLKDSRAFRISAFRDVYASGGGWTHKLQAMLGEKGDRDYYVLYGGIAAASLAPMVKDYDLYLHIFKGDGTYLATRSSTNAGTAGESVNCHSTNKCPAGAGMFIIEVRGKDAAKDFGPWPYWLTTNWAQ